MQCFKVLTRSSYSNEVWCGIYTIQFFQSQNKSKITFFGNDLRDMWTATGI